MSKTIRVEDDVYLELEKLRDWKETFSTVIRNLVFNRGALCRLLDQIEGSLRFREWQREQLEKKEKT